jgi:hypothetical protein
MSRADEIYKQIEPRIIQHKGKIIVIEPESGDYFIGEDVSKAYQKAIRKHTKSKFVFKRIGFKATYAARTPFSLRYSFD